MPLSQTGFDSSLSIVADTVQRNVLLFFPIYKFVSHPKLKGHYFRIGRGSMSRHNQWVMKTTAKTKGSVPSTCADKTVITHLCAAFSEPSTLAFQEKLRATFAFCREK